MYLNELDQFVKHQLKARHYLRYSDDFVLVHEDPAQLLAWREQIREFLAERLRLSLTDSVAKPQLIKNGVDFLGYIVRPDYLLVRRRVVSRLKARLRDYEQKLVRPQSGYILFRHDSATLAGLRATWASYRAHLNMANSHRLWAALVSRSHWLRHFFTLEDGLLIPRVAVPPLFRRLRDQYRFFADRFPDCVLLLQVGRFYECYDEQAVRASRLLGPRLHATGRGGQARCGVPVARGPRCARMLVARSIPVAVVRETEDRPWLGGVKPRALTGVWEPVPVSAQGMR